MTEMRVFKYNEKPIRTTIFNEYIWFYAKDVCEILGLTDVSKTLTRLDDDEKLIQVQFVSGQNREVWFVSEPGLYALILGSRKANARHFKRFVTHNILPEIRRTGQFVPQNREGKLAAALILAKDVIQEQSRDIQLQKPKIDAFDRFLQAGTAQSMLEVSKLLDIGRNTLFRLLREKKILMKSNLPYQIYKHFFTVYDATIPMGNDLFDNKPVTYVLPKGIEFISRTLSIPLKEVI